MQIQIIFQLTIAGMNDNAIFLQYAQNMAELALMYCEARQPCYRHGINISPAHSPEHRKQTGPPKGIGLGTFAALAYDTVSVASGPFTKFFQLLFGNRAMSAARARIQPDTREEKYIFFLVFHFTSHLRIVIRKNHPVPATRLDPTALDTESVHTVLQQRCKQSFQFRSATM